MKLRIAFLDSKIHAPADADYTGNIAIYAEEVFHIRMYLPDIGEMA